MRRPAFLEGLRPTLHIAHRGGARLAPENTLAAFRMAIEQYRTDMLELDVHLTKDGVLAVAHDETVDRCTDGSGALSRMSLSELQALDAGFRFTPDGGRTFPFRGRGVRIPTLEEVLRECPVRLNIEVKPGNPGAELELAALLRRENAVERVCIGSESDDVAARVHEALPEACHFYPRDALASFVIALKSGGSPPEDERFHVLDMPLEWQGIRLIDEPLLSGTRARGRWINVWTIDDEQEMRRLVIEGVGGVMTDRPDLLRRVLDQASGAGS